MHTTRYRIKNGDDTLALMECFTTTRPSGFTHHAENLLCYVDVAKVCYYNRTWESFDYQTAIRAALRTGREDYVAALQNDFKDAHGYVNMTAKRRAEFAAECADDETLNAYDAALRIVADARPTWDNDAVEYVLAL